MVKLISIIGLLLLSPGKGHAIEIGDKIGYEEKIVGDCFIKKVKNKKVYLGCTKRPRVKKGTEGYILEQGGVAGKVEYRGKRKGKRTYIASIRDLDPAVDIFSMKDLRVVFLASDVKAAVGGIQINPFLTLSGVYGSTESVETGRILSERLAPATPLTGYNLKLFFPYIERDFKFLNWFGYSIGSLEGKTDSFSLEVGEGEDASLQEGSGDLKRDYSSLLVRIPFYLNIPLYFKFQLDQNHTQETTFKITKDGTEQEIKAKSSRSATHIAGGAYPFWWTVFELGFTIPSSGSLELESETGTPTKTNYNYSDIWLKAGLQTPMNNKSRFGFEFFVESHNANYSFDGEGTNNSADVNEVIGMLGFIFNF